ncbi:MAG TPA: hypothetical protein VH374_01560 [Polyangia bacterium]|nr:hypothetical protein [Polyangia bacterium]
MSKLGLLTLWPVALIACSTSPSVGPAGNVDAAGGSTDLSPGSGGAPGSGGGEASGGRGGAATVTDAGASDSGGAIDAPLSGDSAPSDGGAACVGVFCEDFEQGQLDPAVWDVQTGSGGVETIQQDIVAHGKYALHMHGTGAGGDFALIVSKNMPKALQGAGPIFGRAYLYATAVSGAHVELGFAGTTHDPAVAASVTTKGMNFNYMEFADFSGSWQLGFDLFAPDPSIAKGFVEEASYPPARDKAPVMKWNCIEWEFGDDPEMMVLWVDGKQIDQFDVQHIDFTSVARTPGSVLNGKSSGIIGGYNVFGFGLHSYGASPGGVDRYYDDIVLDTKRVNCLP